MKVEKIRGELVSFDTDGIVKILDLDYWESEPRLPRGECIFRYQFNDQKLIPFLEKATDKEAVFIIRDGVLEVIRFPQ